MPLLEKVGYVPTEKYAKAKELLRQSRIIGEKYDLYPKLGFRVKLVACGGTKRRVNGRHIHRAATWSSRGSSFLQQVRYIDRSFLACEVSRTSRPLVPLVTLGL